MAELPYDVWLHIVSFLNREEVWRLLSVNRTLFSIAMDDHYKTTSIGFPRYGTWPKRPQLRDSTIASRVRTLELRTGPPCRLSKETQIEQVKRRLALTLFRYRSRRENSERSPTARKANFESFISMVVMRNLTSVTALVVQLSSFIDPKFHPMKLAILDNRWTTFACSLRCLSLRTPLEDLAVIIPRDIKLVKLEKFDLNISITYRSSDADELMRKIILPFLTSHKDTLEFLVLYAEESINLSSFLKEIPHIPRLSGFRLNQFYTSSDPTALSGHHRFLQIHQAHLLDLDMKFTPWFSLCPTTETWFTQAWCHVPLPKLRSLSLKLPISTLLQYPEHDSRGVTPYLLRYIRTLTTLSLNPCRFSYKAASVLLPQLGAGVLRTLELFVWVMSPDLLQLFAHHMPNVQSLKLNARYYSSEKYAKVGMMEDISGFCQAMKLVRFPDWKLHNFQLEPFKLHRDELLLALGTALPRVQSLSGLPRSDQDSACGFELLP